MKKVLLTILFLLLFLPFVKAESCDVNKVKIDSITVEDSTGSASEKNRASVDENGINLDLNMFDVGDSITYKMIIRNDTNDNLELTEESFNISSSSYIKYSLDNNDSVLVRAKSTKDVLLKVEYENEVPSNLIENGSYKEEKDLTIGLSTLTNPKTGDRTLILIIIMLSLSVITYILVQKNKPITMMSIIVGLVLIVPTITFASCTLEFSIKSNVEISKIAIFDTGYVVNSKMKVLSGGKDNIKSFKRSETLPDSIKDLVNNQLSSNDDVIISDEELNNKIDIINNNARIIYGYNINQTDDDFIYCESYDEVNECYDKNTMFSFLEEYSVIVLKDYYTSTITGYLLYDKVLNDLIVYNLEEFKEKYRNVLSDEKKIQNTKNILSSNDSDLLIYGWYDNNSIYYYSEKENVYLNDDSSFMFQGLKYLENVVGINTVNASKVKDMSYMFMNIGEESQTFSMDLSNWNTSNVKNMKSMFYQVGLYITDWSIGDLSNWNVSNVEDMNHIFYNAGYNSTSFNLNLSNWDTSKVKNMSYMFNGAGGFATDWSIGDLSNWNVSNVVDMSGMFGGAGQDDTDWTVGDLSNWDTSKVVSMKSMFAFSGYKANNWTVGDINKWDVSNVEDMRSMFSSAGRYSNSIDLNLSGWNTFKVKNMRGMFDYMGYESNSFVLNLSNWDVSNVTDMYYMFFSTGYSASSWSLIGLSNWNVSNVTDMYAMFHSAGYNSQTFELDLSRWNVSKVYDMTNMFRDAGYNATTWTIGDISNWNISNVRNTISMFNAAGYNATTFNIGNLSNWDVSNIYSMRWMFAGSGYNATTWTIGDISSWDMKSVYSIANLFENAGYNATTWSIGNISNWDTKHVHEVYMIFSGAGHNAITWNDIGTFKIYNSYTSIEGIFKDCPKAKAIVNIYNKPSWYANAFQNAATADDASIVVNYKSEVTTIDNIINTKSENSHVTKGELLD